MGEYAGQFVNNSINWQYLYHSEWPVAFAQRRFGHACSMGRSGRGLCSAQKVQVHGAHCNASDVTASSQPDRP